MLVCNTKNSSRQGPPDPEGCQPCSCILCYRKKPNRSLSLRLSDSVCTLNAGAAGVLSAKIQSCVESGTSKAICSTLAYQCCVRSAAVLGCDLRLLGKAAPLTRLLAVRMQDSQSACVWRRSLTKLFGNRFEFRLPHSWGGLFRNDYDHRDFCAIGASAGRVPEPTSTHSC